MRHRLARAEHALAVLTGVPTGEQPLMATICRGDAAITVAHAFLPAIGIDPPTDLGEWRRDPGESNDDFYARARKEAQDRAGARVPCLVFKPEYPPADPLLVADAASPRPLEPARPRARPDTPAAHLHRPPAPSIVAGPRRDTRASDAFSRAIDANVPHRRR